MQTVAIFYAVVVGVALVFPPLFALIAWLYYSIKLKRRYKARWDSYSQPRETRVGYHSLEWESNTYHVKYRQGVATVSTLKAWGFFIGMTIFWSGLNSMLALSFTANEAQEPNTTAWMVTEFIGITGILICAIGWWILEWTDWG